ncbi:trimeric intracellular cation channel family protein [Microbacteriaceae bacterium 4G12]
MVLINIFIFMGIIASAVSGTLVGIKKRLDWFGVICLAVATALGGGVVRDIMIGSLPPMAFIKPTYFIISVITAFFTCIFYKKINKFQNIIMLTDAVGLGVFTAVGASTAFEHHMGTPFLVISMGLITGIGGGIIRDIFAKDIPYVFRKEVYAIASILGAIGFFLTYDKVSHILSLYICLFITFTVRVVSIIYNVHFPVFKHEVNTSNNDHAS